MLKFTAYSIAPSLTKLFNLSLTTGAFPNEWKTAGVVPIPKTVNPSSSVSNYRPISILPVISKVMERHVKEIIDDHLALSNPISSHQWGFMHHRSSTAALITCSEVSLKCFISLLVNVLIKNTVGINLL